MDMRADPAFDPRSIPAGLTTSRWLAPDGWQHRAFEWKPAAGVRARGSLLFQGGRADFMEKHLEAFSEWHALGWRLSGFDWRGQGGSGRFLDDKSVCHAPSLDMLVQDAAAFVIGWIRKTPGPHVVVAHSMGAHLVLRTLVEHGVQIDAAVLLSPMFAINTAPFPLWFARGAVSLMRAAGRGTRPVWREGRGLASDRLRQAMLTASIDRFEHGNWWKRSSPHLTVGGPSWDWIGAALESQRKLDEPGALESLSLPILVLAARQDRLVSSAAIERGAARLPNASARLFEAGHDLLREADPVRADVIAGIDAFLDRHAPLP